MAAPDVDPLPPTPNRATDSRQEFSDKADAHVAAWPTFGAQVSAAGVYANDKAVAADASATAAAGSASTATTQAGSATTAASLAAQWASSLSVVSGGKYGAEKYAIDAEAFANSVLNTANSISSSTSNVSFGTGNKVFTIQTGRNYVAGQFVQVTLTSDISKIMVGQVVSYAGSTLTVDVQFENHSGSFSSWNIFGTGPITVAARIEPRTVNIPATITEADDVTYDTSAGGISQTLPAPVVGAQVTLHVMGANALSLTPAATVSIRGWLGSVTSADTLVMQDGETLNLAGVSTTVWEAR